jgi:hypothetical protein
MNLSLFFYRPGRLFHDPDRIQSLPFQLAKSFPSPGSLDITLGYGTICL